MAIGKQGTACCFIVCLLADIPVKGNGKSTLASFIGSHHKLGSSHQIRGRNLLIGINLTAACHQMSNVVMRTYMPVHMEVVQKQIVQKFSNFQMRQHLKTLPLLVSMSVSGQSFKFESEWTRICWISFCAVVPFLLFVPNSICFQQNWEMS